MAWLWRGLRLYGGARWAVHVDPPEDERFVLRAGFEYTRRGVGNIRPFAAADIESDANNGWTPRLDARAGMWISSSTHWPGARLELGFYHGPSFQGQFADVTHTGFSLGVAFTL